MPPTTDLLDVDTYGELHGSGISKQSFNIFPKIREVREYDDPACTVLEVHPEVCFRAANNVTQPLSFPKKSSAGVVERLGILFSCFDMDVQTIGSIWRNLSDVRHEIHPAAVDDILDAAIACWTAERVHDWIQSSPKNNSLVGILPGNTDRQTVLEAPFNHPAIWY